LTAALALGCASGSPASAQTWAGPGTDWNTATNWSPNTVPNSTTAAVTFAGAALGTVNISSNMSAQSILFSNPTGSYNLTSSAGVSLSNVTGIGIGGSVTGTQTINLANIAGGSLLYPSGSSLLISNIASAGANPTLLIGPNTVISTSGT